jgi:NAD+ kinase
VLVTPRPAPQARFERIAFVASATPEAQASLKRLSRHYGNVDIDSADVVVALGGDGLMLQTLHNLLGTGKPTYGMNRGSVGFLMNEYREGRLIDRLIAAERSVIHPLIMQATDRAGLAHRHMAINEVSVYRQSFQAAKLRLLVDGTERMGELIADGVLVSTPAGSTAYNLSVQGPIIPIDSPLLALTPISPFRPRRWRGALLPDTATVTVETLEADKRPVAAVADHTEVSGVVRVDIRMDHATSLDMLFDPGHNLDERILREQFGG